MITAVFFDLYNTLARFDPPPEYLQKEACHNLGIDADLDLLREGYVTADRFMAEQNATRPINTLTRDERRSFFGQYEQIILLASGIQMTTDEALDVFRVVQRLPKGVALFSDTLSCLGQLKLMGMTIGLITNMDESIQGRGDVQSLCQELEIRQFLDVVVTSTSSGVAKPDPAIFRAAMDGIGVSSSECLHVGDQLLSDVQGAEGAGIKPVLLDRSDSYGGLVACHRIVSLESLVELISRIKNQDAKE